MNTKARQEMKMKKLVEQVEKVCMRYQFRLPVHNVINAEQKTLNTINLVSGLRLRMGISGCFLRDDGGLHSLIAV